MENKLKSLKFITLIILISFQINSFGQGCYYGYRTDPAHPNSISGQPSYTWNNFNWMDPNGWHINKQDWNSFTGNIGNFYFNNFDYNFDYALFNNSDFKPENGWELIKQDLGYTYDNNVWNGHAIGFNNITSVFPYIILYNKFTAKLRVLVAFNSAISVGGSGVMSLTIINDNSTIPFNYNALFMHQGRYSHGLDEKTIVYKMNSSFQIPVTSGEFAFADFQMGYDPCICFFKSGFKLEINKVQSGQINGWGSLMLDNTDLIDKNSLFGENKVDPYYSSFNEIPNPSSNGGGITANAIDQYFKGASYFKNSFINVPNSSTIDPDYGAYAKDFVDIIKTGVDIYSSYGTFLDKHKITGSYEILSKTFDFLSAKIGDDNSNSNNNAPQPVVLSGGLRLNGNITYNSFFTGADIQFATPASPNSFSTAPEYKNLSNSNSIEPIKPIFNDLLGLFALLKTPGYKINNYPREGGPYDNHYNTVIQFDDANLLYAVNPIVDRNNTYIYGALDITYNNFIDPDNSQSGMSFYIDKDNYHHLITNFFALSDLKNMKFNFLTDQNGSNDPIKVVLKIQIIYVFNPDYYGKVHSSIQEFSYPINPTSITNCTEQGQTSSTQYCVDEFNKIYSDPYYKSLFNKSNPLTIGNSNYTSDPQIFNTGIITINGNLENNSGNPIIIYSRKGFDVKPGSKISPNIKLVIRKFPPIFNVNAVGTKYINPNELSSYCNATGSYSGVTHYLGNQYGGIPPLDNKYDSVQFKPTKPAPPSTLFLTLQPNPNNGDFSLSYQLPEDGKVTADVVDMNGRVLCKVLDLANQTAGIYNSSVSCANLAQGVYTLRFVTNQNVIYKRMMVVGH